MPEMKMFEKWALYAMLSAVAGSFIPVLGRIALKGVDPNVASILRSLAMTITLIAIGTALGAWEKMHTLWRPEMDGTEAISSKMAAWKAAGAIALTGVAGAVSWLFYFKALKLADASKVAPIDKLGVPMAIVLAVVLLGERPSLANWFGILLVCGGAYLAAMPSK
jgi:bacterial/archaeal transporter family protein